ncbi:hypothetical protein PHYBOEH_000834 [Phytophthora boehmeriae]|uniref:RxLR effector protein n=1 Tax=Phytophthora boehmeriae TaxID=109152 RepID=A0A8T1WYR1_9STRA|nr:hypothetical protein PHYBOEH_000834 [Phytophthora boehmeriae]
MRLYDVLLVAAVTLLASAHAVAGKMSSAQTMAATTTGTSLVAPVHSLGRAQVNEDNTKRILRLSNEDQEERAKLGDLTKFIKGIKEGRDHKAQLQRNHQELKKFYDEGILTPENLQYMKDQNMISSKKFAKYEKLLNEQ